MLEGRKRKADRGAQQKKFSSPAVTPKSTTVDDSTLCPTNEDSIMTRKPIRTRRPRIPLIQSGYCAICNLPYNSVEDHVQSKKHQKLIGEDANYISLNGYIHSDVGIESLLSLTGIDAIGFDDFTSPKTKRRNMPRTRGSSVVSRASSVVSEIVKPTTTSSESDSGHRLRSRKNINYMTPPLDEDSFQEKPDLEPAPLEYKEYRELRSSTRALAKLTAVQDTEPEVWNSGRPKRACISRQKRISADERLVSDNKTYYKVEVLSNKLRSSDRDKGTNKQREAKGNGSEKGLIVKFKKLRNSELTQLNNEATNFLFPKKDDSSDEDEDEEEEEEEDEEEREDETEEEIEMVTSENNDGSSASELDDIKSQVKVEDDASMDSVSSYSKTKKKRRSHAEAFIQDNQKYYKFETPGSSSYRLRYHGSYLSPIPTKSNGDCVTKIETKVETKVETKEEQQQETKEEKDERLKINLDDFKFSFETIPENEKWYKTFRRQDRSEQLYRFTHNYHWDDFVLPHQIPHLKPMDPKICYNAYKALLKELQDHSTQPCTEEIASESDSNACDNEVVVPDKAEKENGVEQLIEQTDEDSKLSEISLTSGCTVDDAIVREPRRPGRRRKGQLPVPSSSGGRNPRKSPRQHASTLAILSSLIHQRKRRSRNAGANEAPTTLPSIPEELVPKLVVQKPATPPRPRKKKIDYFAVAAQIDEELNTALDGDIDLDFEPTTEPDFVSFKESRLNVNDIMKLYEETTAKENENSCRRFFNGAPGRKPGKRKKNKTGWPNKVKKRKRVKDGESESLNGDGDNAESNDEDDEEENEDSDSIIDVEDKECNHDDREDKECNHDDRENKCDQDIANRVENNCEIRDNLLQPYVYVKKIDSLGQSSDMKVVKLPKRTIKRPQRRKISTTTSPKAPRMLRRSKGRWYRER